MKPKYAWSFLHYDDSILATFARYIKKVEITEELKDNGTNPNPNPNSNL